MGTKFYDETFVRRFVLSAFVLTLALLLNSCGAEKVRVGTDPVSPPINPPAEVTATLALFGAPHCSNCKEAFPKIQTLIDQLPAEKAKKVFVVLYVTEKDPGEKPTPEVAESYRKFLGIKGAAAIDEWRWKKFRAYVGGTMLLPGAAILDAQGNVVKSFRAGATTFIPTEIVHALEEAAK